DLDDLVLDRGADPGQLLRLAVQRELGDGARGLAHARRRAPVGEDAEAGLALELEDVREQLELGGDVRVPGQRLRHAPMIRAAMRPTVCPPTYDERENVERMVRTLHGLGVGVLVIDDNSPDGTGQIADGLAAELDGVDVLHRERKEGLGPAYIAGFRHALAG